MIAPAVAAIVAFNLVCTGTQHVGNSRPWDAPKIHAPFRMAYRVDLESLRWCSGDCQSTAPIYEVSERHIKFEASLSETREDLSTMNRETGEFYDRHRDYASRSRARVMVDAAGLEPGTR